MLVSIYAGLIYFNPRTHEECDPRLPFSVYIITPRFQSTHSRGVRLKPDGHGLPGSGISIHALTRSATVLSIQIRHVVLISIHALTRSATKQPSGGIDYGAISIHALTRSATD